MKNKIIGIIIFLISIIPVAPMVTALQVDTSNPTSQMLKTFSTDSFKDTNKNWTYGLCTGFNDIINPACPVISEAADARAVDQDKEISPHKKDESPLPFRDDGKVLGASTSREPSEEPPTTTEEPPTTTEEPPTTTEEPPTTTEEPLPPAKEPLPPAEKPAVLGVSITREPTTEPSDQEVDEDDKTLIEADLATQKTPKLAEPTIKPAAKEPLEYLWYIILIIAVLIWFISRTNERCKKTTKKYFKK